MSLTPAQIKIMAGRLVVGRLPGLVLDDDHKKALAEGTLGGITLFKDNADNLDQLVKLTGDIIEASHHPPVLTVDQEGGAVQRFEHVLSALPSPMAVAALNETYTTKEIASINSRQLKTLGFNMLLAPTLDLQSAPRNPIICTRAYGDDPDFVTTIGAEVAEAIEAEGLIAVGKHFPGHGSTVEDSHLELAQVDKSEEELLATDLVPFANLARELKAILIGHIWLPRLVKEKKPATLSYNVIEDLLRVKLKFDGLVVSDDMIMKAITDGYGLGEACVQAILAGVDLLLVCGTFAQSQEAVEAITAAVISGRISQIRLRQAEKRLNNLVNQKPSYLSNDDVAARENFNRVLLNDAAFCRRTSARAICVRRGSFDAAAAERIKTAKQITVVAPAHPRYPMDLARSLIFALEDRAQVAEMRYPVNPSETACAEAAAGLKTLSKDSGENLVIFLSYRSAINTGQARFSEAIRPAIHIAMDSPYDLEYLPGISKESISLAAFDPSDQAIAALTDVLLGEVAPEGQCPVKITPLPTNKRSRG